MTGDHGCAGQKSCAREISDEIVRLNGIYAQRGVDGLIPLVADDLAKLRRFAGEQRNLIMALRAELLEVLRSDGGCDHSVGICVCHLIDLIKRAGVIIGMKRCRACGCTEDLACAGGCAWADVTAEEEPICTECAGEPRAPAPSKDNQ